ncbi:hypothetical protein ACIPJG_30255 [Streptomyces halstedii]|uniref:hypothetical protein n=1 Tax=Streptomyces TaxID=1883 RepID=UPI00048B3B0A|nr:MULTISPECIES: hypothetical protein [unclassified Streptomyces]MYR72572.1 hypothetical protein [Streptomyces sp. SID4925]MYY17971.1 hypothetical protein [Streptomyces sp. SID4912]SBU91361.1 hypothetical protein YUMDRAFT_03940 [Streptomyces sp. OspMP-M45]SCD93947.1 hypothetical protein GA0115241_10855 [Streptomyces sp. DpondAA-D4]SCE18304.1 hypothetical protein GA0115249_114652 [Streptomyces sp. PpalLS-921]
MTADKAKALDALAEGFADQLTSLTRGVLGEGTPRFHALNMGSRIRVSPITDNEVVQRIPVRIGGEERLSLGVRYFCCWDGSSTYMATDQADLHLFYAGIPDPLLRYEYVRGSKEPPGAHLQIHAHRDEMAYLLRLAERGRPKHGLKRDRVPRLAEMHLPVGGHRMRPALEDVLLFMQREFAIDTEPGWKTVVDEHLRNWRLMQLKTAVRDAPDTAAQALRGLGYTVVEPPGVPAARHASEEVKLFWP